MDHKIIVGIFSVLATIIGIIIGAISTQVAVQRRIQMENVTQERAKWREKIRCLASEVHQVIMTEGEDNCKKQKLLRLKNMFHIRLNPYDCHDNEILEIIDPKCEQEREERAKRFGELVSSLLKHDWDRAKEEVKHPLFQWRKPMRNKGQCKSFLWCKFFWCAVWSAVILFLLPWYIIYVSWCMNSAFG